MVKWLFSILGVLVGAGFAAAVAMDSRIDDKVSKGKTDIREEFGAVLKSDRDHWNARFDEVIRAVRDRK